MSEPVTVETELIAGMEQVILHIQHQESSIQELKKSFEQAQETAKKVDIKNKELETANNFLSNIVEEQTKKIGKMDREWVEERDDLNEHISMLRKDKTELKKEIKTLKEACDICSTSSMRNAHDYEVLSEKMANDSETFVGVIGDLESQVKSLESENNNLKCVLNHKGIDKTKYEQILKLLADDCEPDAWDCM